MPAVWELRSRPAFFKQVFSVPKGTSHNMMTDRLWFPLFTAISTALALFVVSRTDSLAGSGNVGQLITILAGVIAALLFAIFDIIIHISKNSHKVRILLDRTAKFEGVWLEYEIEKDDDSHNEAKVAYGIFTFKHTGKTDERYIIRGNLYDFSGKNVFSWRSIRMKCDRTANVIDYFYRGHRFATGGTARGFCRMSLDVSTGYLQKSGRHGEVSTSFLFSSRPSTEDDTRKPHSGIGYYVSDEGNRGTFHLVRVTRQMLMDVIGPKFSKMKNFEIERCFVRKFHEKYGEEIIKNGYLEITKDEDIGGGAASV